MVTQLPLDGAPLVKTAPSGVTVRLARKDEVETLRRIERSAAQAFRLIEAFSWQAGPGFCLGVQWHPEWQAASNPVSLAIFRAFGAACLAWRDLHRPPSA